MKLMGKMNSNKNNIKTKDHAFWCHAPQYYSLVVVVHYYN